MPHISKPAMYNLLFYVVIFAAFVMSCYFKCREKIKMVHAYMRPWTKYNDQEFLYRNSDPVCDAIDDDYKINWLIKKFGYKDENGFMVMNMNILKKFYPNRDYTLRIYYVYDEQYHIIDINFFNNEYIINDSEHPILFCEIRFNPNTPSREPPVMDWASETSV